MPTEAATFCATVVDEWWRSGIADAFVAPGSRSTPLALALAAHEGMNLHVFHDERSAAFTALGFGLATNRPAVVVCTSGTAGTHFHAAVVEADLSAVPLIVCTADRPPELWDVGAPQTVNQSGLYGNAVRFYCEPGVPDRRMALSWRSLASQLVNEALGASGRPGPVHANLSFVDPLVGEAGDLPEGRADGAPWHADRRTDPGGLSDETVAEVWQRISGSEGVIIAGRGTSNPEAVIALSQRLGWPLLADHRSGCRVPGGAMRYADALLRIGSFAEANHPGVVLRFGEPLASKSTAQWLIFHRPFVIAGLTIGQRSDPERLIGLVVNEHQLAQRLLSMVETDTPAAERGARWQALDDAFDADIDALLAGCGQPTEPGIARSIVQQVPDDSVVVTSSSMPVRDVEWYGVNRARVRVLANRGANGIDGVVATAIGSAITGTPTTVLIGDLAFLHDSSSLIGLASRSIDLTIVVVDNDGGGIFSFLPQADVLPQATFEQLFGTPHGTDVEQLCKAHGLAVEQWPPSSFVPSGVRVVVARTDRDVNRRLHAAINQAVETRVLGST